MRPKLESLSLSEMLERLNKVTDIANDAVNDIEAKLEGIGVSSDVEWRSAELSFPPHILRWKRHGSSGRHRFVVKCAESDDDSFKAWGDCSREIRLNMFVGIPILYKKILQDIKNTYHEKFDKTMKTIKELQSILDNGEV